MTPVQIVPVPNMVLAAEPTWTTGDGVLLRDRSDVGQILAGGVVGQVNDQIAQIVECWQVSDLKTPDGAPWSSMVRAPGVRVVTVAADHVRTIRVTLERVAAAGVQAAQAERLKRLGVVELFRELFGKPPR